MCKVKRVQTGPKGIPFLVTHDGRTIRYPDPVIKVNDTIHLDIATSKILDSIRFDSGNYVFEKLKGNIQVIKGKKLLSVIFFCQVICA